MESAEIQKKITELKKSLSDMRFKLAANQIKNVKEYGSTKKEIARLMTAINKKTK